MLVYVLAVGTFLMGATEFMVAGVLPEMAHDLHVSEASAGLLITAFAVGMIAGAPLMALATLHLPRRLTLRLALGVFALGHVVVALSSQFAVVLAARVVTAVATGAFWSVASVVATKASGPDSRARALSVIGGGLTIAAVVGVPLGSWIGEVANWRAPFWVLGAAAAAAAVIIGRLVPGDADPHPHGLQAEFAALRHGHLWLSLAAAALIMGGVLACYSYVAPLLTGRAGLPPSAVPLVLVCFGIGAFIGTNVGGRLGDRRPFATSLTAAVATSITLLLLLLMSRHAMPSVTLVALIGLTGFTVNPIVSALAVRFAGDAPTLTAALTVSAFNTGTATGSALASLALDSSLGLIGPIVVGAVITSLTIVPLVALQHRLRR